MVFFKNNRRGNSALDRKQRRKEQRKDKKVKRAVEYKLHTTFKKGKQNHNPNSKADHENPSKKQQLQALVEAEKERRRAIGGGKGDRGQNGNNKSEQKAKNENTKKRGKKRKKGPVKEGEGFQMSSATTERMARLQEYVNQEARKMGTLQDDAGKPKKKKEKNEETNTVEDSSQKPKTKKEIEREKKLKEELAESDREIKKYEKLLKINKTNTKKISNFLGRDIGSLIEDIDRGEIHGDFGGDKYEDNPESEDDLDKDMAIALGKAVPVKKKKTQKTSEKNRRQLIVDGFENENYDDVDDEQYDEYEGLGGDDFDAFENGFEADSDEGDNEREMNYGDYSENSDYGEEVMGDYMMGGKERKKMVEEGDSEDGMFSAEGEWSSDDGGVDESIPQGQIDFGRVSRDREEDFDGEEEEVGSEGEEEEEDDNFLDDEAMEGTDEESDDDGRELVHDIRKEEEYAFEGGSSYYSKPEILKNGQENDIDKYSSNSEDDTDLEDFVVDDEEVEFENVYDELPEEEFDDSDDAVSDTLSPVKKRKKKRLIVDSDNESEQENKESESGEDADSVDDVYLNGKPKMKLSTKSPRMIISDDEDSENEDEDSEKGDGESDCEDKENLIPLPTVSSADSDTEEEMQPKSKKSKKNLKIMEDDSASGSDNEMEEEIQPKKNMKKVEDLEDEIDNAGSADSDAEEEIQPKSKQSKKKFKVLEDDSAGDSDNEMEEELQQKKNKKKVKDFEDDSENAGSADSDMEEEIQPKSKKVKKKKVEGKQDDNDNAECTDSDDKENVSHKGKLIPLPTVTSADSDMEEGSQPKSKKIKKKKLKSIEDDNDYASSPEKVIKPKSKKKKNKKVKDTDDEDDDSADNEMEDEISPLENKKKVEDVENDNENNESADCDMEEEIKPKSKKNKKGKRKGIEEEDDHDNFDNSMKEKQPVKVKEKKVEGMEDESKLSKKRKCSGETSGEVEDRAPLKKKKIESESDEGKSFESDDEGKSLKSVKTILKKPVTKKMKKEKGKSKDKHKRRVSFDLPDVSDDDDDESEDDLALNAEFSPVEDDDEDDSAGSAEFSLDEDDLNEGEKSTQDTNVKGSSDDELTEDIYGRLRDKEGKIVQNEERSQDGKYIPPALRKLMALQTDEKKKEQLARIKRTLKGLFNRLAESNLGGIANQIEGMFVNTSHNDMCDIITEILIESIVGPSLTPERLVQEHALLLAVLSSNIGEEIGAHILNEFVLKWSDGMKEVTGRADQAKELDNMLLFIANLYNFKIVDATLVYGILGKLADSFRDKEVELILLLLRNVGFTLRKDNPLALKSFITKIQGKAAEAETKNANSESFSRIRFMLEIIQAIRNNHMAKVPNYDPTHVEHLKKVLKGLIHKGKQVAAPLKVSLEDLLNSRECGRWWIVGSAFSGGLIDEKPLERKLDINTAKMVMDQEFTDSFREKAAKLKLSRPPRINILYIVTEGSEDYLDAFDKLIHLNLPSQQERELFNVIMLCVQKGKEYNPFFAYLSTKMCKYDRKFKRLLQFALWDKFRELEELKEREVANLAKFVSHIIGEDGLNLSLFKSISFMEVEGQTISFIRQILIGLLLHRAGANTVENIFSQLHLSPKLRLLRQSLRVFIKKFLCSKKSSNDENYQLLSKRIELVMEILGKGVGVRL